MTGGTGARRGGAVAVVVALAVSACTSAAPEPSPDGPAADAAVGTPSPVDPLSPAPPPPGASATPGGTPTSSEPAGSSPATTTTVPLRIERRTSDDATADFVTDALAVLRDPRGWVRAGFVFEAAEDAPYLLVLAEGDEVDALCLPYDTFGRFSCQNGPVVALNADRWRVATEAWPDTLDAYRTYLVNHEVGHLLHLHHPSPQCPGAGLPAPVMLQQSTELGACTANPWPLPWEVDLAAARPEPLAPPADHDVDDHRPSPPAQQQDLSHTASG